MIVALPSDGMTDADVQKMTLPVAVSMIQLSAL